jgi:HK97 family phage portal protein
VASLLSRFWDSVRSFRIDPKNAKDPALARLFDGGPVAAGVHVNNWNALTYSAVWSAVGQISSTVASLPLKFYKRLPDGGKEAYVSHRLYELLHDNPNPEMTSFIFREMLQAHVLTWGNAYAEIERDGASRPVALWPIPPDRCDPVRDEAGRLAYRVRGVGGFRDVVIPAMDMLHVPGLGFDGMEGYSVIEKARESFGLGLAAERFGATFFGNGSTFGGFLSHPARLSPEARQNLQESLKKHEGPSKAHRILLLQEGMTYLERKGIPPNDAQFLQTREFQIQEVARWFRISPYKLGDLSRATFSNIEHQAIEYYTDTIRPWLVRWEQEINRKLVSPLERRQQFAAFVIEGALRGDVHSRYSAYAVGRQWGWLSADDVRELENMNPLPRGQGRIYLLPQNMVPADRIGEIIDKQVEPTPSPQPQPSDPQGGNEPSKDQMNSLRTIQSLLEAKIPELQAQLEQARTERSMALEDLAQSGGEVVGLRAALAAAEAAVEAKRIELAEALSTLALTKEQRDREEARAVEAEHLVEDLTMRRDGLQAALEAAGEANTQTAEERDRARADLEAAEQRLLEAEAAETERIVERDAARQALESKQADIDDLNARILTLAADVEARRAELDAKVAASGERDAAKDAELQRVLGDLAKKVAEVENLAAERAALAASVTAAESALAEAQAKLQAAEQAEAERAAELDALTAKHEAAVASATTLSARLQEIEAEIETRIQQATKSGRGAMVSAHRALYQDAMTRLVEREIDRIIGARSSANKLRTVMGPFYDRHVEVVRRDLVPLLRVHLSFLGRDDDAEALAADLADQHVAQSRADLAEVYAVDPDEFPTQLSQMIQRWRARRTTELAEYLMRREIEHG